MKKYARGGFITNADRIRAMADEELAAYLEKMNACGDACPAKEHCMKVGAIGCFMTLLEWLRQPCEGGKP